MRGHFSPAPPGNSPAQGNFPGTRGNPAARSNSPARGNSSGPGRLAGRGAAAGSATRREHPHLSPVSPAPPAPDLPASAIKPAEPSWGSVLANTARLWAQRRAGRADTRAGRRRRVLALIIAVVILAAAGIIAVLASGHGGPQPAGQQSGSADNPGAAAVTSAVAVRGQAATWVAHQVNKDATVACDPVMCAALHWRGFPAANLVPILQSRSDPLGAELVVATAALRNQFGALLPNVYAPQVIASFGTGQAAIQIRTIPPEGSAAFRRRLGPAERSARKQGSQLLGNKRIAATAPARAALAGGHVDSRLLATLAALAAKHPIQIVAFGDANPGAGPAIPFRSADLAGANQSSGLGAAAYQHWLVTFLRAQRAEYRATFITVVRGAGGALVRVEFAAPSEIAGPGG